jgi:hypothetical protein
MITSSGMASCILRTRRQKKWEFGPIPNAPYAASNCDRTNERKPVPASRVVAGVSRELSVWVVKSKAPVK